MGKRQKLNDADTLTGKLFSRVGEKDIEYINKIKEKTGKNTSDIVREGLRLVFKKHNMEE